MAILDNIRNVMNKVIRIVCILLFAFMVIIGTYQILVRYIFNNPSTVSEELLTYSFTWMSLFAAAYVFGKSITSLSMTQKTASLGIPMGYVYIVIPITGVVIAVYGVLNVICLIRKGEEA